MRKVDLTILVLGAIVAISWAIFSNKDGFKGSNSTIVARSIAITATIDGQVENNPPIVGSRVSGDDLLARIHNGRFDRSRLIEFQTQIAYLESEIGSLVEQQRILAERQESFMKRADYYANWQLKDLELQHSEVSAKLEVASARKRLKSGEVNRAKQLYDKHLTSELDMQIAKTQAEVASAQVDQTRAQWHRSSLLLQAARHDGVIFENGDTSYWAKSLHALNTRHMDNSNRLSTLQAELNRAHTQASAEELRISSSYAEEHRAPFTGVVNARFVTEGSRVTSGTNLMEILDCANPIVIIPIPDNRLSEFSVGLKVTVYPTDTEQALPGRIDYISSGPLIGSDKSIQIHREVTLDGNRAIVSLEDEQGLADSSHSCETARKAVVVIHTDSFFDTIATWFGGPGDLPNS